MLCPYGLIYIRFMLPASLRTLLTGLVDYAGLFPPAQLPMKHAVEEYASYLTDSDAWMLGRFVVPVARLAEFEQHAEPLAPPAPSDGAWRLSALSGDDLIADVRAIGEFNAKHAAEGAPAAVIDTVEFKVTAPDQIDEAWRDLPSWLTAYAEFPLAADPAPYLAALKTTGGRAKARTGGVVAVAFPPAAALARFIVACIRAEVPFKATAGLHHPLRGEYRLTYERDSANTTMFGFLNVFLAGALARSGAQEDTVAALLGERDGANFAFDENEVRWRGHVISLDSLAHTRTSGAIAFGSCSFREPVDDLRNLALL